MEYRQNSEAEAVTKSIIHNPQPGKMLNNGKPFTLGISEFSGAAPESLRELK